MTQYTRPEPIPPSKQTRPKWVKSPPGLLDVWQEQQKVIDHCDVSISILGDLNVKRILLDVVPGDGSGLEVYAKSVADVVDTLTRMSTALEEAQGTIVSLKTDAEQWRAYKARKDAVLAAGMGRNPLRGKCPKHPHQCVPCGDCAANREKEANGICPDCDGTGEQGGQFTGGTWTCEECSGTGKFNKEKTK